MASFLDSILQFVLNIVVLGAIAFFLLYQYGKKKRIKEAFSGKSAEYLSSAKKMVELGEYKLALSAVRNSVESLVKYIGSRYGMYFDESELQLLEMIDVLADKGVVSDDQRSLMHKARIEGNKGSHVALNEADITKREASHAIKIMDDLILSLQKTHGKALAEMFLGIEPE